MKRTSSAAVFLMQRDILSSWDGETNETLRGAGEGRGDYEGI